MMKKLFFFGMIGAMALSFNACTSDEDALAVNPTFDGEAVKTQFTLNVGQGKFATRMSAANVQATTEDFLGLDDMVLFAFNELPDAESEATATFELGSIGKTITENDSRKFYTLQIPVGTNNFVFYGNAPEGDEEENGTLDKNVTDATSLGDVTFDLVSRYDEETFEAAAEGIAEKLSDIANVAIPVTLDGVAAQLPWSECEDATLAAMYAKFTGIGEDDIRAGYDFAVNRMLADLKAAAEQLAETGLNDEVKALAEAIAEEIDDYEVEDFPGDALPAGVAQLEWVAATETTPGKFQYKTEPDLFKVSSADPATIAYPAELVYWDNSDLGASDVEKEEDDYPNGAAAWLDFEWADNDFSSTTVKATTRAIAMKRNINYGVAGLHSTVSWLPANATTATFADNTAALVEEEENDKEFTVDTNSFTLKGILIGGQPQQANWELLPADGSDFNWIVYDNQVSGNESYTLLLDNYDAEARTVNIALEFTNNMGEDFYGVDGIIPAGGTFYLVGQLAITDDTPEEWTDDYENDRIEDAIRIFAQDRMTVASFKFGEDALKHAYETIPDLQSVSMLFGLSVDIKWLTGLSFEDIEL